MTIGSEDENDEEEEKFVITNRMQNFAKIDDCVMPPTIFYDDTEFMHPSTSSASANANLVSDLLNKKDLSLGVTNSNKMDSFVKNFFDTDTLFQPLEEGNVIFFINFTKICNMM